MENTNAKKRKRLSPILLIFIILAALTAALVCAAFLVFPNELADLANQIRRQAGLTAQITLN